MVRQARLISTKIKIRGLNRLISRTNQIIGNVEFNSVKKTDEIMKSAKERAAQIIRTNTDGSGLLAETLVVRKQKTKEGNQRKTTKWTLTHDDRLKNDYEKPYSRAVNEGFRQHWVMVSNKPKFQAWLQKHFSTTTYEKILEKNWFLVGGPNSAPWTKIGLHYFETAYKEATDKLRTELRTTIKNSMRGK